MDRADEDRSLLKSWQFLPAHFFQLHHGGAPARSPERVREHARGASF
jgi:hypothetical protein